MHASLDIKAVCLCVISFLTLAFVNLSTIGFIVSMLLFVILSKEYERNKKNIFSYTFLMTIAYFILNIFSNIKKVHYPEISSAYEIFATIIASIVFGLFVLLVSIVAIGIIKKLSKQKYK